MDELKRKLLLVEGKCYSGFRYSDNKPLSAKEKLEENNINNEINIIDVKLEAEQNNTLYKHSFYVHREFLGTIIGKGGKRKKALEHDFLVCISTPSPQEYGPITLTGSCGRDIVLARHKIEQIVYFSRHYKWSTHDIYYPIRSEKIINEFKEFKTKVLKVCVGDSTGFSEDFFQLDEKLNIKIEGLFLWDNIVKEQAVLALYACEEEIIKPFLKKNGPLTIGIRGIECNQTDTTRAKDLYANVLDENGHLLSLSQKVVDYFLERGLMKRDKHKKITKLKMALIQTTFSLRKIQDKMYPRNHDAIKSIYKTTFDATKIIEELKDTYFGKITLSSIRLSVREDRSYNEHESVTIIHF